MIYFYAPYAHAKYWMLPLYLYGQIISLALVKRNIKFTLIEHRKYFPENMLKDDLLIFFTPKQPPDWVKLNGCSIIFINTESCWSWDVENDIKKYENVKMIWDYSLKNINHLKTLFNIPVFYVPPTYSYFLENHFIKENVEKDIDFLQFGKKNERRNFIGDKLIEKGYNYVMFAGRPDKLYEMINRSKIIIIIHYYEHDICVDSYRLFYLLANKAFVIHEKPSNDEKLLEDIFNKVLFSKYENILDKADKYIKWSQKKRDSVSFDIYKWYKKYHSIDSFIPFKDIRRLLN